MIKDIIANLSVTENGGVVGDYAVSVAAALQAHLTGVAFIYDPIVPTSVGRYNPVEVIETQRGQRNGRRIRDQELHRDGKRRRNFV